MDRIQDPAQRQWRSVGQVRRKRGHPRIQRIGRHHVVDDAQLQRAGGGDRRAQQAQFQRGGPTAQAQQPLAATEAGNQAEVDLRLADPGAVRGDAQVAGHGQFQAAAQRKTIDAGQHRLGHAFDAAHQLLAQQREVTSLNRAQSVHFRDVGTGHECLRAGPGQHHHPHLRVRRSGGKGRIQRFQGGAVERVELVRPVHRDGADGAVVGNLDRGGGDGGVDHGGAPEKR
ncbi:hypothetical protein D3C71_786400 [compost metagenome]